MYNTIEKLSEELKILDEIIYKAEKSLKTAPKGILRISRKGNSVQYYKRVDEKDKNGKYIKKKDIGLAYELAQKEYNINILKAATMQKMKICRFLKQYMPNQILDIYTNLPSERQMLIKPYILTQEQYVKKWENREYTGKEFGPGAPEIYTEKGERVRSKSEKILADKFYLMNIPYLYEYPLQLKGYGIIYPDFTLLNKRTRQEFYLEHFGKMDDEKYSESTILKIESYERNGIFPGEKLLMTYETSRHSLNMQLVEQMITKYLI